MTLGEARTIRNDLFLIAAVWFLLIATLIVLQMLRLDFGFNVWPIGEFRNWLNLLQSGKGIDAAKVFWTWDYRNPLSPWWYLAARPLILTVPAAPLILHLLAGLVVGLSAYLLFTEVTSSRAFGLSLGILCALFIPDVRRDDVIWVFVGAVGCTLLSIWLFARYCKGGRNSPTALAASYVTWFMAFATYTLQAGAMAAVFLLSYRNRRSLTRAIADVLPYAALLLLYVMIWITAASPAVGEMYRLAFSFDALMKSIAAGLWNEAYSIFWIWVRGSGPLLMAGVFAILAPVIWLLIRSVPGTAVTKPQMGGLGFALLIGTCVVAPTVAVEAMSATWFPGTRWPMLLQFWSPLVFCLVAFAVMSLAPDRLWRPLWHSVTACAAAFAILLVLGFNSTQVIQVRLERVFFSELQSAVIRDRASGVTFPRRYLIELAEPAPFLSLVQVLAGSYARTILGADVTFSVMTHLPEPLPGDTVLIWKDQRLSRP